VANVQLAAEGLGMRALTKPAEGR